MPTPVISPEKQTAFDRNDTKAIKGVAVLLMLFHHLAAFSYRMPVGFVGFETLLGTQLLQEIASASKFCVSLFFFLGGYGLYIRFRDFKLSITSSILNLYKSYWKVFSIFIPIAYLLFNRSGDNINALATTYAMPRTRDYITAAISDFTAWSCTLNGEWWFLKSYICVIPLGYLFCRATQKSTDFWVDIFLVFGLDILLTCILPTISTTGSLWCLQTNIYFTSFLTNNSRSIAFFAGIVFAKYDGIRKLKQMLQNLSFCLPVCFAALAALVLSNLYVTGDDAGDIVYCAALIPILSVILDRLPPLKKAAMYLGKHSTNMWLIHSFYCYYFLEFTHIVYCTQNVWIDLAILVVLSLVSSILVNGFWKQTGLLFHKFSCTK